jgi:hypothetical protein
MMMLYNSDSFAVMEIDFDHDGSGPLVRGGYEIVDKFARKEIFLEGAMAQTFKEGVEALVQSNPSEEEIDEYIGRYASIAHQPMLLH